LQSSQTVGYCGLIYFKIKKLAPDYEGKLKISK